MNTKNTIEEELQKIYKTRKQKTSRELEGLTGKGYVTNATTKEIKELYRDRSILPQKTFTAVGGKSDGITGGYEATDKKR